MESFMTYFPSSVCKSLKKITFFLCIKSVWVIARFPLLVQQEMPCVTEAATNQSAPGHSKQNLLCALPVAFRARA